MVVALDHVLEHALFLILRQSAIVVHAALLDYALIVRALHYIDQLHMRLESGRLRFELD